MHFTVDLSDKINMEVYKILNFLCGISIFGYRETKTVGSAALKNSLTLPMNENGTHSSPLAWKVPGTEEPGGLQSMGSLRVGHD